jgi:hypothetical protein
MAALTLAAIAVCAAIALYESGTSADGTPSSEYAGYPALQSNAPTELELVSSHNATRRADRPTWSLQAPEGAQSSWPLSESIRKLDVHSPNMTAWIAKSLGGGICVLLWVHQPAGGIPSIGASCSGETAEDVARGATTEFSEMPGEPGRVFVAGVVPSTVAAVKVTLADGNAETATVSENAWSLEAEGDPQVYQTIPVGG